MNLLQRVLLLLTISLVPLAAAPTFSVSFPKEQSTSALDGRLLLMVSTDPSAEPRTQINNSPNTQMIFGIDVDGLAPGQETLVDERAFGYPVRRLSDLGATVVATGSPEFYAVGMKDPEGNEFDIN